MSDIQDLDSMIIAVVIGLFVSVNTEIIKKRVNQELTTKQLELINLLSGWIWGMIAMIVFGGDFTTFSLLGLAGGVWAPGIYDIVVNGLGLKGVSE